MYGMIHQAVRDLAITRFGRDGWDQFASRHGLTSQDFIGVDYYPDSETMALLHLIAEHGEKSYEDLLYAAGYHLISFIDTSAYARILNMAGGDMDSFLDNLDLMHTSLKSNMPLAVLPSFQVSALDRRRIGLLYISRRKGLTPFVRGLLFAVADRFGETIEIEQSDHEKGTMFTILRNAPHA